MARFSLIHGKANCRLSPKVDWAPAYVNQPIRQGEQIYVPANSRAEIVFDDGSVARLGGGAFVTMQTLYSDDKGEFTEVKLNDGLASWRLKNKIDVYQIDTPCFAVKATGPARFRVGARDHCEVADRSGNCTVESDNGKANLQPGQLAEYSHTDNALHTVPLPPDDSWEKWNEERDHVYDVGSPVSDRYLPPDVALAAPDLDNYGTWVDPFGWTWVGAEPWGWAPYHYGTWVHASRGWGWCPGPAQQCWSPAVVSFSSYNGSVAWAPLAPEEVSYPSRLAIGFSGGDWSVLFSIGGCGAYYPGPDHRCFERAWNNTYINRVTYVTNYNNYGGHPFYATNHNSYLGAGAWTPRNARFGGGSIVAANRFGTGSGYGFVNRNNIAAFQHGRAVGVPGRGIAPAVGPAHVRPTLASLTPGRSFSHVAVPAAVASRALYRAPLAPNVARVAPSFGSRIAAHVPGQANVAGRPGVGMAHMAGMARPGVRGTGAAGVANRPGTPNTSHLQSLNRPGVSGNRTTPAAVQSARRALGVGGAASVAAAAAHAHAVAGRNKAAGQVQTAHQVGVERHTSAIQSTSHSASASAHRTTPTHTGTAFAQPRSVSRPSNQSARVSRPSSTPRTRGSFARPRASASVAQRPRVQSAPRNYSAPRGNSGGGSFARPSAPPHSANSGSFARPSAPPRNFGGGGGGRPSAPPQAAPRGGGGGGGRPSGGNHDRRG
jgi:hypothetical protein